MKQALDEITWIITKTFQVVALFCCITYGMTGWMRW